MARTRKTLAAPPPRGASEEELRRRGIRPASLDPAPPDPRPPVPPPEAAAAVAETETEEWTIYTLADEATPERVGYVGLTKQDLAERVRQHQQAAQRGDRKPVSRWLRTLWLATPRRLVLYEAIATAPTRDAARAIEKALIAELDREGRPLVNVQDRLRAILALPPVAGAPAPEIPPPVPAPVAVGAARPPRARALAHPRGFWPFGWPVAAGVGLVIATTIIVFLGLPGVPAAQPAHVAAPAASGGAIVARPADPSPTPAPRPEKAHTPIGGLWEAGGGSDAPGPTTDVSPPDAPAAAPARIGTSSLLVGEGQSFTRVAELLDTTPDALAAQLGRQEVYAGETIAVPVYADPPVAAEPVAVLAQGGGGFTLAPAYGPPDGPARSEATTAYTGMTAPPFVKGEAPLAGPTTREGTGYTGCDAVPYAPGYAPCR